MIGRIRLLVLSCCMLLGCGSVPTAQGPETSSPSAGTQGGQVLVLDASSGATDSGNKLTIATDPGEIPYLRLTGEDDSKLPLKHTDVRARLTGFVAEVEVRQTYSNPHEQPIEAIYVFPLPENSAVHKMRMVIGDRVIESVVQERQQARHTYERAKSEGHTAALLEQERPNIFTQSVANIAPGEDIDVVVRYVQDLTYDAGRYEFVFPMVVGPRFMPGQKLVAPPSGTGTHQDTTAVPDASRISPPFVGRGERSGHDISLEVLADTSLATSRFEVPTHDVLASEVEPGLLRIRVAPKDSLPNRDFVLRYAAAQRQPSATLYLDDSKPGNGFFSLVLEPPRVDIERAVGRREMIFVVDVSGSMSGVPLGMCREAMREAIGGLRPVDTFNIYTFAGATQAAFDRPRPANDANVREALQVIDGLSAGGGTMMADAVRAALRPAVGRGRHRYVFFMTDGYVGNEDEIISASKDFVEAQEKSGAKARVFGFGVGSSVNRYLIDGISSAGKGLGVYATTREDPARAVNQFYHYVDQPVLEDLQIDWGNFSATELMPREMPDLFASHAVILHGRTSGTSGNPHVTVSGRIGGQQARLSVQVRRVPASLAGEGVMGTLWARSKIGDLEQDLWQGTDPNVARQITELGLRHHLVTRFTSLVAVDRTRRVGDGRPQSIAQPLDEPEGVDVDMAGGRRASKRPSVTVADSATVTVPSGAAQPAAPVTPAPRAGAKRRPASSGAGPTYSPAKPKSAPPPPPPAPARSARDEDRKEAAEAEPSEGYGYSYDDDPMNAGGFRKDESAAVDVESPSTEAPAEAPSSAPPSEATPMSAPTNNAADMEQVEPKRGCGCRAAGSSSQTGALFGWLALCASVLLWRQRRARSRPRA
ncbi:MAG: VWA domain-containing protein [Polyangiaceae bacterium]|nr:VWA domain-containing protein [Polyangiaceae bacterium]